MGVLADVGSIFSGLGLTFSQPTKNRKHKIIKIEIFFDITPPFLTYCILHKTRCQLNLFYLRLFWFVSQFIFVALEPIVV
jgi:hypothetical protein